MDAADCRRCEGKAVRGHRGDDTSDRVAAPADAPPDTATTVHMRSVSPDDRVAEVIAMAVREHLQLVTNGSRFALCSVIPAGWRPFASCEYTPESCR